MWNRINLRMRIYTILITLVMITLAGGVVMIWYTYRMQSLMTTIIDKNVASFQSAEELEMALVNQKGFVSYYFLDQNTDWLRRLGEYRQIFKDRLEEVRLQVETRQQKEAIDKIESEYLSYISSKDHVISYYKTGSLKKAAMLHPDVREHFFKVLELTNDFKKMHAEQIRKARVNSLAQAKQLRIIAETAVVIVFLLGIFLAFIFSSQILGPLRRLASKAVREGDVYTSENEVKAISRSIRGLLEDVDHRQSELEKSQGILLQAEKMALVGKLAAGTSHSIRNPLTSVKMRLFSLSRSLELDANQKEDFDVISEEITHIDTIVENFLEFSRPPRLKMRTVNPKHVVDLAIKLLQHRLESYGVRIRLDRKQSVPDIQIDPEQLKEVLVNLIINACESMHDGGLIIISEGVTGTESSGQMIEIRITDNGPGIPKSIQDKVFQPFFSTKEEGTGLGLSIAVRIIEQHGGSLKLTSKQGEGTTFIMSLPVRGVNIENNPDN